ncbi:MAG: hypothetical protein ABFR63_07780 [Thermodesulfobacteriota bacterium]
MATSWEKVKKYRCIFIISLIFILITTARVQGDIATLFERVLLSFVSGVAIVTCVLYGFLYLTGSLNPGDKAIVDFKKLGGKLWKGKTGGQGH